MLELNPKDKCAKSEFRDGHQTMQKLKQYVQWQKYAASHGIPHTSVCSSLCPQHEAEARSRSGDNSYKTG